MTGHSADHDSGSHLPALPVAAPSRSPLVPERSDFWEGDAPAADKVEAFLAQALEATGTDAPTTTEVRKERRSAFDSAFLRRPFGRRHDPKPSRFAVSWARASPSKGRPRDRGTPAAEVAGRQRLVDSRPPRLNDDPRLVSPGEWIASEPAGQSGPVRILGPRDPLGPQRMTIDGTEHGAETVVVRDREGLEATFRPPVPSWR